MLRTGLGLLLLAWAIISRASVYKGLRAFYRMAQDGHLLAVAALTGPIGQLALDYRFAQENAGKPRLSDRAIAEYSDDSLSGYGDANYAKGGDSLADQQRGLMIPTIERALASAETIVEIGTGNGDVVAHLAEKFPDRQFVGVDFSVRTAQAKHRLPNLRFVAGYALDLLEQNSLTGDMAFASSTFVVFTPLELRAYVRLLKERGFRQIILSEPMWGGHRLSAAHGAVSQHMERATWYHNYTGYLREAGYTIQQASDARYRHPRSPRPDIRVALVHAIA